MTPVSPRPAPLRRWTRDEHGMVLPTRVLALAVSALALGGLLLVANNPDEAASKGTQASTTVTHAPSSPSGQAPSSTPTTTPTPAAKPKPKPVKRGAVHVEVFNNTHVHGLAGSAAGKVKLAGWDVIGTDNWYGTVDSTTVYYPPDLKRAGQLLGRDLGVKKVRAAQDPMRMDRLTLILTDDYSG